MAIEPELLQLFPFFLLSLVASLDQWDWLRVVLYRIWVFSVLPITIYAPRLFQRNNILKHNSYLE